MNASARTRRRPALITAAIVFTALLSWLLWPLSSREWEIASGDAALAAKDEYLAAERAWTRRVRAGATETGGAPGEYGTASGASARTAGAPPNVVLIVADDLALTDISRYEAFGGLAVPTPAIDRIGTEGATFTAAHATAAICAPSRAAILTGRYQQRYGFELQPHDRYARTRLEYLAFRYAIDTEPMMPIAPAPVPRRAAIAGQGLPAMEITLAELLRARGYRTAVFGKWHLGYDEAFSPLRRGFDEHYGFYEAFTLYAPLDDPDVVDTPIDDFSDRHMWSRERTGASAIVRDDAVVEEDEYLTFRFADLAADFIAKNAAEPFFLYLPFNAPHTPLQAPRAHYERFAHVGDPVRRTYAAMITALDDGIATVLDALEEHGVADDTIVVFTSDNGGTSYLGVTDNAPLAGGKFTTFQGGIAVPLLLRFPRRVAPGTVYAEPVSLLDLFATVDAATTGSGGEGDATASTATARGRPERPRELRLDGVDLLPYLDGREDGRPADALYWRSWYNKAVRRGEWKLIVTTDGSPGVEEGSARYELYNLRRDPAERVNVASSHPEVVADLLCRLSGWEGSLAAPSWPPVMHFWLDIWDRRLWFAI